MSRRIKPIKGVKPVKGMFQSSIFPKGTLLKIKKHDDDDEENEERERRAKDVCSFRNIDQIRTTVVTSNCKEIPVLNDGSNFTSNSTSTTTTTTAVKNENTTVYKHIEKAISNYQPSNHPLSPTPDVIHGHTNNQKILSENESKKDDLDSQPSYFEQLYQPQNHQKSCNRHDSYNRPDKSQDRIPKPPNERNGPEDQNQNHKSSTSEPPKLPPRRSESRCTQNQIQPQIHQNSSKPQNQIYNYELESDEYPDYQLPYDHILGRQEPDNHVVFDDQGPRNQGYGYLEPENQKDDQEPIRHLSEVDYLIEQLTKKVVSDDDVTSQLELNLMENNARTQPPRRPSRTSKSSDSSGGERSSGSRVSSVVEGDVFVGDINDKRNITNSNDNYIISNSNNNNNSSSKSSNNYNNSSNKIIIVSSSNSNNSNNNSNSNSSNNSSDSNKSNNNNSNNNNNNNHDIINDLNDKHNKTCHDEELGNDAPTLPRKQRNQNPNKENRTKTNSTCNNNGHGANNNNSRNRSNSNHRVLYHNNNKNNNTPVSPIPPGSKSVVEMQMMDEDDYMELDDSGVSVNDMSMNMKNMNELQHIDVFHNSEFEVCHNRSRCSRSGRCLCGFGGGERGGMMQKKAAPSKPPRLFSSSSSVGGNGRGCVETRFDGPKTDRTNVINRSRSNSAMSTNSKRDGRSGVIVGVEFCGGASFSPTDGCFDWRSRTSSSASSNPDDNMNCSTKPRTRSENGMNSILSRSDIHCNSITRSDNDTDKECSWLPKTEEFKWTSNCIYDTQSSSDSWTAGQSKFGQSSDSHSSSDSRCSTSSNKSSTSNGVSAQTKRSPIRNTTKICIPLKRNERTQNHNDQRIIANPSYVTHVGVAECKVSPQVGQSDLNLVEVRSSVDSPKFTSRVNSDSGISSHSYDSLDGKSCLSCNCDFSEHDVSYTDIMSSHKLSMMDLNDNIVDNGEAGNEQYLWVPQGIDNDMVEAYMNSIPLEKVPHMENPEGVKYYNKQLIQQLPLQDSTIDNVQTLARKDQHYLDAFKRERDPQVSTGVVLQAEQKLICNGCKEKIYEDDVYVYGHLAGEDGVWHPNCFICCTCEELLVNLIYGVSNDEIFCARHHAEQIKPRCQGCDELIFCGEYIRTEEKAYHSQHFVCVSCERGLSGEQHLLDEGQPICIQCYDEKFANKCNMCGKTIGVDEDDVMYDDEHWHDYCLVCHICQCKLSGTSFVVKDGNFLCSECFRATDDKKCNVCGEGFEPGTKRLELRGEFWHDTCFVCDVCKDPITSKKFIHHEGKQVCCECFDQKFAKRCDKCKQILKEGGVSCGGVFFHRDCFACESCNASIANQAFQQKDGMRYCTPCYKQMYAKVCSGCQDYIINGEFYTVETDNWHKNCFKCVSCGEILRQQSFVQENGKIKLVCESCL